MLNMKYRPRIYYSGAQKALMWDRWQKGDSMHTIARLFDRNYGSVQRVLSDFLANKHETGNHPDAATKFIQKLSRPIVLASYV